MTKTPMCARCTKAYAKESNFAGLAIVNWLLSSQKTTGFNSPCFAGSTPAQVHHLSSGLEIAGNGAMVRKRKACSSRRRFVRGEQIGRKCIPCPACTRIPGLQPKAKVLHFRFCTKFLNGSAAEIAWKRCQRIFLTKEVFRYEKNCKRKSTRPALL